MQVKGKLHSKIISSDMKDFFRRIQWWGSEVEIRTGRRSNRRSKMAEKSRVTTPHGRHESWCRASAVRGYVPILINPEFDAALDRDSCVTHWMSSPGSASWYTDIWQSFFFFFFVVSWVLFDKSSDRVQSVTQGTWYSGRSSMLNSDSWLIDIGERSHPNLMHRSSLFQRDFQNRQ